MLVQDYSADPQSAAPNSFAYSYDADGQTTAIADASPGAVLDAYAESYDQAGRLTQLQEQHTGTVQHTTTYRYNPDGQPTSMTHDTEQATYGYDVRNLLASVTNKLSSTDPTPHTTAYTYTPAGQVATQTKGNGNIVSFGYNLDTSIATQVEKTSAGALIASHTYTYDPNLNPVQDVSSVQNADNHAAMVANTATDTYTPADQIASVTNSNGHDNQAYAYDLAGNITSQTIGGTTTANVYDRNRLQTATTGGTTAGYNYDPFGRTDTITAAGKVTARYTYDGFDNITSESKLTASGMATTSYTYDPLGRKTSRTINAGTAGAATDNFDYLAASPALADVSAGGTIFTTYQYSPTGQRLDMISHQSDGTLIPFYYTYNAHTDVQAITDATGNTKATYGYTAYGADDTSQDTGLDQNTGSGAITRTSTPRPVNPYRFNHDLIDPTTATLDTGFRTYDPSIGRFLTRDMYQGALADQNLTTSPYTGNPYTFANGNPLTNIELDGHRPTGDGGSDTSAGCWGGARCTLSHSLAPTINYAQQSYANAYNNYQQAVFNAEWNPGSGDDYLPWLAMAAAAIDHEIATAGSCQWGTIGGELAGLQCGGGGAGGGSADDIYAAKESGQEGALYLHEVDAKLRTDLAESTQALNEAGDLETEIAAADAGSNIVYRGLAEGEDPAAGLKARAPGATDVSPLSHVAGKGASPWISTTKSLATATTKYGKFGVVGIDLNRVSSEVVDISGGFPETPGMFSNWAIKDQEVLIRDYVPPEAIVRP